ncbi:MAG: hypothetical protein R2710_20480 [Acidimicrobiales bacterium]
MRTVGRDDDGLLEEPQEGRSVGPGTGGDPLEQRRHHRLPARRWHVVEPISSWSNITKTGTRALVSESEISASVAAKHEN